MCGFKPTRSSLSDLFLSPFLAQHQLEVFILFQFSILHAVRVLFRHFQPPASANLSALHFYIKFSAPALSDYLRIFEACSSSVNMRNIHALYNATVFFAASSSRSRRSFINTQTFTSAVKSAVNFFPSVCFTQSFEMFFSCFVGVRDFSFYVQTRFLYIPMPAYNKIAFILSAFFSHTPQNSGLLVDTKADRKRRDNEDLHNMKMPFPRSQQT